MAVEEQVVAIYAGVRGYLDVLPTAKVGEFEQKMLDELRASNDGILASIRAEKQITNDT